MNLFEIFGGAVMEGINQAFGLSCEEAAPPQRPSGGGSIDLTWFAVERDELEDFVDDCQAAGVRPVCADEMLAVLLKNDRAEFIPQAAMRIAQMQAQHPSALIFVAAGDG